jgi:uncharacterized protein
MDAEALVLSLLEASPGREVAGRKRLQKLAFFASRLGVPTSARFFLYDYGPFSAEVASAIAMLPLIGEIDETDRELNDTRFVNVYSLNGDSEVPERLPQSVAEQISKLHRFTTIELEVASTILFYKEQGVSWSEAFDATRELKPSKTAPTIIANAKKALAEVDLYERRGKNTLSCS